MNKHRSLAGMLLACSTVFLSCTTKFESEDAGDGEILETVEAADQDAGDTARDDMDAADLEEPPPGCGNGTLDEGEDCDDRRNGNPDDGCTDMCRFSCRTSEDCDDFELCNGIEQCRLDDHVCVAGGIEPPDTPCPDDGIGCTLDRCNAEGVCTHPVASDTCLITGDCWAVGNHPPSNPCLVCSPGITALDWTDDVGAACDDGVYCTVEDHCRSGARCEGETADGLHGGLQVSAGNYHTCALIRTSPGPGPGVVKCWGSNGSGQLGNGSTAGSDSPVDVTGLGMEVTAVAAGGMHTCALLDSWQVMCWGKNNEGQLGIGSIDDIAHTTPTSVAGLSGSLVIAIAAGQEHTCALLEGGGVKCWGYNEFGQVGNGASIPAGSISAPTDVLDADSTLLIGVSAIAAGGSHTCALISSLRTVNCWGNNGSGELGNGSTNPSSFPVNVRTSMGDADPLTDIVALALGSAHSCALTSESTVLCWGMNHLGQLGDGSNNEKRAPVQVINGESLNPLTGAVALAAGGFHTCTIQDETTAKCWGSSGDGQLGNGSSGGGTYRTMAVNVIDPAGPENYIGFEEIDLGLNHSCAVLDTTRFRCWGDNGYGQLGNGSGGDRVYPEPVQCGP